MLADYDRKLVLGIDAVMLRQLVPEGGRVQCSSVANDTVIGQPRKLGSRVCQGLITMVA
jgi:hypothetical protein